MLNWRKTCIVVVLVIACHGCSSTSSAPRDALTPDSARSAQDTLVVSDSQGDTQLLDTALTDTFAPLPGLGDLAGACGILDEEEWQSNTPFFFRNTLDFAAETYAVEKLSPGGQEIITDENLGGGSLLSEAFAFEVLYRCELATLLKTEREIDYQDIDGKKTDLLLSIDARKVGVSVTRAYHYPAGEPYTAEEARTLLEKKLPDVLLSADNATTADAWQRSILHILAYDAQHADMVQAAYEQLDAVVQDKTIVVVTVTEGQDSHIY
ncbi:MAG: hypothetical protein JRH20_12285 [Deltaproteobacteria bacterium]|nr:hypothetical protein [Deltaproteobacteria bacterium]